MERDLLKTRRRRQVFPECLFWVVFSLFQAFRQQSAREKFTKRKKNEGRLEGERGRERRSLTLAPPRSAPPPRPVFLVYNFTRSLLTAALYYLNAWNRVGCLQKSLILFIQNNLLEKTMALWSPKRRENCACLCMSPQLITSCHV